MTMLNKKTILMGALMVAAALILSFYAFAAKDDKEEKTKAKTGEKAAVTWTGTGEVTGEISHMDDKYIAVVYARDEEKHAEYEVLLPIDGDVTVEHKNNIKDLVIGDTVTISYDQGTEEEAGTKNKKMKRRASKIKFVKAAPLTPPEMEWGED